MPANPADSPELPPEATARPAPKSAPKPRRTWQRTPPPDHTPSTAEWIDLARKVLIEQGVGEVKIDKLARLAGVTRGGFYWRFKGRQELLDALIEDWRASNTTPILRELGRPGTLRERMLYLADLYISGTDFDPAYDTAMRAWAGFDAQVAAQVHAVDETRIEAIRRIFEEGGHSDVEALVRARVTYFHQVGYFTLQMAETTERRRELRDIYVRVLTGLG